MLCQCLQLGYTLIVSEFPDEVVCCALPTLSSVRRRSFVCGLRCFRRYSNVRSLPPARARYPKKRSHKTAPRGAMRDGERSARTPARPPAAMFALRSTQPPFPARDMRLVFRNRNVFDQLAIHSFITTKVDLEKQFPHRIDTGLSNTLKRT